MSLECSWDRFLKNGSDLWWVGGKCNNDCSWVTTLVLVTMWSTGNIIWDFEWSSLIFHKDNVNAIQSVKAQAITLAKATFGDTSRVICSNFLYAYTWIIQGHEWKSQSLNSKGSFCSCIKVSSLVHTVILLSIQHSTKSCSMTTISLYHYAPITSKPYPMVSPLTLVTQS